MNALYRIQYEYNMSVMSYVHEIAAHTTEKLPDGTVRQVYIRFLDCQAKLRIDVIILKEADCAVDKYYAIFSNNSDQIVRIHQFDAGFTIPAKSLMLNYFTSDWGSEFYPHEIKVENEFSYGSVSGRSCRGFNPWAGLLTPNECYTAVLAWSGNWNCKITTLDNNYFFSMGLSSDETYFDIKPGGSFTSAPIYVAKGTSIEDSCLAIRRFFRKRLSLLNDQDINEIPVVYNGWWPYEDSLISEDVYLQNAVMAKNLGITYAVLDAGWFGNDKKGENWYDKRGDWELINLKAFPSGMKSLCDRAKSLDISPGMWCEIEAVGKHAKLNETHKDLIAERDGVSLGYICLGSKKSSEWALSVIDRILGEYGAKWIKFDFNLDPAFGCNALHHDHAKGDGLYAHYKGYYELLKVVHKKYPDVILENCSSGGLRMDIEMLSHTHFSHLSDPDYTDFHLQCFWGALSYLHQSACFHFSWSHVLGDHNRGINSPINNQMQLYRFDYIIRAVLMGIPGFSYRLPDMPERCFERLKEHVGFYKRIYKDFILNGDAHRLTPQPIMGGKGERFPVFQFNNNSAEALLFAFRLEKANSEQIVFPKGLLRENLYEITYVDKEKIMESTGWKIEKNGIDFYDMPEESSEIVWIKQKSTT